MDREWIEKSVLHHFPSESMQKINAIIDAPELLHFAHNPAYEEPLFLVSFVCMIITKILEGSAQMEERTGWRTV